MFSKIRDKFRGKSKYGKTWGKRPMDWYTQIHEANYLLHEDFIRYLKSKKDVKTVLEVGCGTGVYPIRNKELFSQIDYTGTDISETAIEYCKKNSSFNFICGDFIKNDIGDTFDLVYSHAVIDHVYDIDTFVKKIVNLSKKYAYINSYRGYFPDMEEHKMNWSNKDGCYYNDVSVKHIKKILLEIGLQENEFVIRAQKSGQTEKNLDTQMVVEITKIQQKL